MQEKNRVAELNAESANAVESAKKSKTGKEIYQVRLWDMQAHRLEFASCLRLLCRCSEKEKELEELKTKQHHVHHHAGRTTGRVFAGIFSLGLSETNYQDQRKDINRDVESAEKDCNSATRVLGSEEGRLRGYDDSLNIGNEAVKKAEADVKQA
eukprot:GHVU01224064.1.p1 GENE.GHVU01224064.1~~GHVU01224064.1.p1  ORF type:complete len:154 (+),score=17.95 GHVU01224064.1:370-831(+)